MNNSAALLQVKQSCGWSHIFVAYTHGANAIAGSRGFGFRKIRWATASFRGDHYPTVKQVIFSKLVIWHNGSFETDGNYRILVFPKFKFAFYFLKRLNLPNIESLTPFSEKQLNR
jgi:hypothetical protein